MKQPRHPMEAAPHYLPAYALGPVWDASPSADLCNHGTVRREDSMAMRRISGIVPSHIPFDLVVALLLKTVAAVSGP